ncbi:hypothetical protein [Paraburkholderia domus]|uniref:hypothetical protein n=1 Tax=Paraburkholderia domus TaxID=2793075 RepID=UPI001B0B0942|nr:hypothetical protein [Paraburkholderia domus]CAE6835311.1 hypothetical protein R75483_06890 [Paraburkholderia domus]
MKRLIVATTFAFLSLVATATTLSPIQMLNPAGSTSGQVITSTGASSAPGWSSLPASVTGLVAGTGIGVSGATGNVTVSLANTAANTVLANATGSSAAPAAFSMPSCSTSSSALQYTSGTGFTCYTSSATTTGTLAQFAATTSAQLAGVISDETGSGALVYSVSPTITTPNIIGVSSGTAAPAGSVAEYPTPAVGTTVSLTSATPANCTSMSLTAGDWDVFGSIMFNGNATTSTSVHMAGFSTTSATLPAAPYLGEFYNGSSSINESIGVAIPPLQKLFSATTTVYLVAQATFTTSTETATCVLQARRRH